MFAFAAQNGEDSGKLSGGVTEFLMRLFSIEPSFRGNFEHIVRKTAHFCMFGLEGILLSLSLIFSKVRWKTAAVIAVPACIVLAALNEYAQTFADGRSGNLKDVCIDSAGAFLGIALVLICYYCMKSRRRA